MECKDVNQIYLAREIERGGVPRNIVRGGGVSTNSVEDREQRVWRSGGSSP